MSFSSKIIAITLFICSTYSYGSDHNISEKQIVNILNDINYTYNIVDMKLAKSTQSSWKQGKAYGYFTAIAYRAGFDHGYEVVRVLVKQANEHNGTTDMRVIKDIQIDTPGIAGYITDMTLEIINNKLSLGLDIRTRIQPNFIVKQSLLIDLNGKVTNLIPFTVPFKIYDTLDK